jgi:hypothetical protein
MANTVYTASTLSNLSYEDLISWINVAGENPQLDAYIQEAAKYGVSEMQAVEDLAGTYMNFYKNDAGQYTITSFNNTAQITNTSPINSNMSTVARSNVQTPLNRSVNANTNKIELSTTPASGSFAQNAKYVLGTVGGAVAAASTGITLGKVFSGTLYNLFPDFFDEHGMWAMNPATWSTITNGDDSPQSNLFNLVFGIDPATGNSQAYIDETAFAYMAQYLATMGAFNPPSGKVETPSVNISPIRAPFNFTESPLTIIVNSGEMLYLYASGNTQPVYYTWFGTYGDSGGYGYRRTCGLCCSKEPFTVYEGYENPHPSPISARRITVSGKTLYWGGVFTSRRSNYGTPPMNDLYAYNTLPSYDGTWSNNVCYSMLYDGVISGDVEGISDQPNATLPTNIDAWTNPQTTLDSLKQQYPDLWNNALTYDNVQPDGTNPQKVYIPVATPTATSALDNQPLGGDATQTQANTQIQPSIDPQTLIQLVTSVMTQPNPQIQTAPDTITQPTIPNPVDTGDGDSPTPVVPTGSASALWSVYHPTQQQVNDFGGWLWSSNFIDQLLRMFQNPMDAVVSLRKVFVMPVDAGVSTIHAGYLDSEVPSSYITQQYVFKDCGIIDCYEQFGNVFDYVNTEISMYLPFIGIVPLNTSEVMRSQLHVVYGVDMFTGACLASIEVIRDGNTVTMYQYAGNASVEYPLSGQRASSFLGGLMSLGGAAASIATGGGSVVAAGAAINGMSQMSTVNVSHSGSFSGNAGAMGIKKPYLIIERPQTKVASNDEYFTGYSNNYSGKVSDFSGMVKARKVHVLGINATDGELAQIESLLKDGIII